MRSHRGRCVRGGRAAGLLLAAALAVPGCSGSPTTLRSTQPAVRYNAFLSGTTGRPGEDVYATQEVFNDGPGTIWFTSGCAALERVAMGDSVWVYLRDSIPTHPCPELLDSLAEGAVHRDVLRFTGSIWDSLGIRTEAPEGDYVARLGFTYSARRDVSQPVSFRRDLGFHWMGLLAR